MSRLGGNLTLLLSVLLMLGTGWYHFAKQRLVAEIAAVQTADPELVRLRAENGQLKQRLRAVVSAPATPEAETTISTPPANPARRAQIVADLRRSGLLGKTSWPSPDLHSLRAGMADVAEILGLTAAETAALQRAAEGGEREFAAAIAAHASVQREGATVTLALKDEPEVHAAYDRMLDAMAAVLGPERYGYYESLGAKDTIEKLFDVWGLKGTTVKVAHATAPPDAFYPSGSRGRPPGPLQYYYTQDTALQRTESFSSTGPAPIRPQPGIGVVAASDTREHLEINIGPIAALVPPDL